MSQPISLEGDRPAASPVIKRQALGEHFVGALVKTHQRDVQKKVDGVSTTVYKANGKARQELVVTLLTMPGTTSPAGIGDEVAVPAPGEVVRMILRGGGFANWLDAKKALGRGLQVGDIVTTTNEFAQVYDADGNPSGGKIVDQAAIDAALRARKTVGVYGPLTIRQPTPAEQQWVNAAEQAYHLANAQPPTPIADDVDKYI